MVSSKFQLQLEFLFHELTFNNDDILKIILDG